MSYDIVLFTSDSQSESEELLNETDFSNFTKNERGIYNFLKAILSVYPELNKESGDAFWAANPSFDRCHIQLCCRSSMAGDQLPTIISEAGKSGLSVYDRQEGKIIFAEASTISDKEATREEVEAFFNDYEEWDEFTTYLENFQSTKSQNDTILVLPRQQTMSQSDALLSFAREQTLKGSVAASLYLANLLLSELHSNKFSMKEKAQLLQEALAAAAIAKDKAYYRSELESIRRAAIAHNIQIV